MKKIVYWIIPLLLAAGCREDKFDPAAPDQGATLTVRFNTTGAGSATRALDPDEIEPITAGMIDELWMMVFNENGNYLSRHLGELSAGEGNYSEYTFDEIPVSEADRMLHFVANYDWVGSDFSDFDQLGRSESEVLGTMSVAVKNTVPVAAYWQRVPLSGGFSDASPMELDETVHLLRNVAQVSVVNQTSAQTSNGLWLTDVEFAVGDAVDRGTVAPFNTLTGSFGTGDIDLDLPADDFVTEAAGGVLLTLDPDNDFVAASGSVDIYERKNSVATRQTYLIVKGVFQDGTEPANTAPSYYKIDICDADATRLLDIRRNHRYRIEIDRVSEAGFSTPQEAIQSVATNNINASVAVSEYPAVSDGSSVLRVENTLFTFVKAGEPFSISYAYIDASSGATKNDGINIALTDEQGVVADWSYTKDPQEDAYRGGATITGTTGALPTGFDVYRAILRITHADGLLSRNIELQLRRAVNFLDVQQAPADGIVPNVIGQPVTISFKIPADVSQRHYPIPIYISTKRFSPDPSRPSAAELAVDFQGGEYRYVYNAPYLGLDENNVPRAHTIYLISNAPNTDEKIVLSSDMFNSEFLVFGNPDDSDVLLQIGNFRASPNGENLPTAAGVPVEISFDVPANASLTPPYEFRLFTTKLDFVSCEAGTTCTWNPEFGCYVYITPNTGTQRLQFRTNAADSRETIRVAANRFAAARFIRSCALLNFTGVYDPVFPERTAGEEVEIRLGIPGGYDWAQNGNQLPVTFYPQQTLEPLPGDESFEAVSDSRYGAGYRYTFTGPATQVSMSFQTLHSNPDIRTTVDAPGFNTLVLTAERPDWSFVTPRMNPLPRQTNSTTNRMAVIFSLPEGSVGPDEPVTVTMVAPYLTIFQNGYGSQKLAQTVANGNPAGNVPLDNLTQSNNDDAYQTITISGLTTTGPHVFYVRNTAARNGDAKTLRARYFENSGNLNQ